MKELSRRRALLLVGGVSLLRSAAKAAEPCCGPITSVGRHLAQVLDGMHVESLWLAHEHVDWQTGRPDESADYDGPGRSTHCSAFAAAVGLRLGVCMLRPPEHGQVLLASAQTQWFGSAAAQQAGWRPVATMQQAQELANRGELVVICSASPNPRRPGHIVIVRPSLKSVAELDAEGPQVIQAAARNRASYPAAYSFTAHPGAWPSGVRIFAHGVP
jgi:hypothetical protein